jgi:3',5'-cyclic AMP phosphodiesterase CpdA
VLYTAKEGGGDILYKESLTSAISFGSQFTLINSGGIPLDYSTASHQPYNYKTVIMVTNSSSTPIEAVSVRASDAASTDITAPTVLSISRQSPSTQLTNGSTLKYRAVFSESVNGVDISDFKLTPTGSAKGTISAVTATDMDGFEYDVTVSSVTGVGDLRLDLQSSTGITIKDASGNNMTKTFSSGQPYTIDQSIKTLANIIRGPYLQVTSGTGITVRWRTDIATDSKVVVGTTYGTYTISGTSSTSTTEHIVRVTGLKASTKYFYRFGTSANPVIGDAGNYFTTAPPTSTKQKIRVAAFGDAGHFDITQTNVFNSYLNNTTSDPADLMLILGDNAYEDGTDSEFTYNFFKPFEDPMLKNHPLFPTPGNHDYHTTLQSSREAPYFKSFTTPQAGECGGVSSGAPGYYSFNWGNIHFLSLDSYGTETSSNLRMSDTLSPQVVWVKKDLEANTLPWTIVFFHHPPFTKGTRNSDTEGELIAIRQNFIRILERYGVDIVLTGHSHVYERSYLLRNYYGTEAEFNLATDAVTTSSGKYDGSVNSCPFVTTTKKIKHGTVYVVSGAASSIEPDIDPSFPHDALPFSSLQGSMFFFEVENNRLDAKCFREDGTTIDQFSILKTVNKTNNISITQGSSVTIKATWPGLYKWSTGATTNSITVTPTANTTYTVTDGMGCLKDVFNITVTPAALTMNSGGAINETLNGNSIAQVFPNIVERGRSVTIRTSNNELMDGALLDENGSLIRSFKFNGTTSLETSKLPAGVYFIMVKNKDKVEKQRIVVTTN